MMTTPAKCAPKDRRPAGQSNGSGRFVSTYCRRISSLAAVAELDLSGGQPLLKLAGYAKPSRCSHSSNSASVNFWRSGNCVLR
jgi:hypothetical protein